MDYDRHRARNRSPLLSEWLGPAVIAISFLAAAAISWRKWPDPFVDFGAQLYLPWRIASGSVLYRDVMYLTGGPLSQYYHALLFKIFGASLLTVVFSNLIITAGLLTLIYRRFLAASDAWTATMICLAIVLVFAFNQYSDIGNFNFMTPYCHEVWHGVAISIVAIALLSSWVVSEKISLSFGAGFCAGFVFMTKPEVFVALAASAMAAFILVAVARKSMAFVMQSLAACLAAGLIPLVAFALYFHQFESWQASFRSVSFAWVPLLSSSASHNPFYFWCLGLDVPSYHLRAMLIQFFTIVAVLFLSALLFRRKTDIPVNRVLMAGWVALVLALASGLDWVDCGRSLPLLALVLCGTLVVEYRRLSCAANRAGEPSQDTPAEVRSQVVFPLLWGVFGLALLTKLGLFSRVWHYGFVLAMPAFAAAIYLLFWLLPRLVGAYGVQVRLFRLIVGLVLVVGLLRLFVQSSMIYRDKTVTVGRGKDEILAFSEKINPAGAAVQAAAVWIQEHTPTNATLAVLPEGVTLNYLTRRANPTRYFVWNPVEMATFGQTNMIEAFEHGSPDYVVLIHRDPAEFGVKFFGKEERFGLELMKWLGRNYEPVFLIGQEPLQNSGFGIKILKKTGKTL